MEHTFDATNQKTGRLATQVAVLLMGKDLPDYRPNVLSDVTVKVTNASKLDISRKKKTMEKYDSYSGYPGGLKQESMQHVIDKHGYSEVLRKAVRGMLPNNKLRPEMLKNLIIEE